MTQANVERLQATAGQNVQSEEDSLEDRLEAEEAEDTMLDTLRYSSLPPGTLPDEISPRFRRTGSERLRDGAKAFLRRVESLKSRRRKRQNRDGIVISGPQIDPRRDVDAAEDEGAELRRRVADRAGPRFLQRPSVGVASARPRIPGHLAGFSLSPG